jgi:hypothetical protein
MQWPAYFELAAEIINLNGSRDEGFEITRLTKSTASLKYIRRPLSHGYTQVDYLS